MKFKVDKDDLLLNVIREKVGYTSQTKARKLIKAGSVHIDGEPVNLPNQEVKAGQSILIEDRMHRPQKKKVPFPYEILHEDEKIMAIVKPAGIASISPKKKIESAFGEVIRSYRSENPEGEDLYLINKVDKKESGILILAKGLRVRRDLEELWPQTKLRYYVLAEGKFEKEDGVIKSHLLRNKIGLLHVAPKENEKSKEAILNWRKMKEGQGFTILKVDTETDIKNQIRAQMEIIGRPVVGDERYGSSIKGFGRIGLHLFSIRLKKDEFDPLEIKTPVPKEFLRMVKLRNK